MFDSLQGVPLYVEVADDGGHRHHVSAKRYVRVRIHTRPGSLVSLVVTEAGGWRFAERQDPAARLRVLAKGKLPSGVVEDETPWDRRR
jgi:hypothetical protein